VCVCIIRYFLKSRVTIIYIQMVFPAPRCRGQNEKRYNRVARVLRPKCKWCVYCVWCIYVYIYSSVVMVEFRGERVTTGLNDSEGKAIFPVEIFFRFVPPRRFSHSVTPIAVASFCFSFLFVHGGRLVE